MLRRTHAAASANGKPETSEGTYVRINVDPNDGFGQSRALQRGGKLARGLGLTGGRHGRSARQRTTLPASDRIQTAPRVPWTSSSYQLVGGADLASVDPMRTLPGATGRVTVEGTGSYTYSASTDDATSAFEETLLMASETSSYRPMPGTSRSSQPIQI